MDLYVPFVEKVTEAVGSSFDGGAGPKDDIEHLLSSAARDQLRKLVPLEALRGAGVFFTPRFMAELLWERALPHLDEESIIVDPACGAGDLLLPPVRHLTKTGMDYELERRIRGGDVESNFVAAAKARLRIAVHQDSGRPSQAMFDNLQQGNFWEDASENVRLATHVVINPPYTTVQSPAGCTWASGGVNAAALFVDSCLRNMRPGTWLLAVLPDVLRSGSRYEKWRLMVEEQSADISIEPLGQFDARTDVHVFMMHLRKAEPSTRAPLARYGWSSKETSGVVAAETVGDFFKVSVGPLVPHRHPSIGDSVPAIAARDLPVWSSVASIATERPFSGTLNAGPFVVIRRTSRPGDNHRARATLILDTRGIAVENHLIVLKPTDGRVETCQKLMRVLADSSTTQYLNMRINCRHLTVGAVREIPWKSKVELSNV